MANFLRGHVEAFEAWQGVPRELWYDNLKSVVLERRGDAIRFNPRFLDFAGRYRFLPKPVAIARGNEKGRVERAIRYVRDNFFAAWRDLDDLNARAWYDGIAADRPWPDDRSLTVREAFERERGSLMVLPDDRPAVDERIEVRIGKTPYARFDKNDYSVPHTHVRRTLTVVATLEEVRILDGMDVIARHTRSFDKAARIEDPEHIEALVRRKRHAHRLRGQSRLLQAAPNSERLLAETARRPYRRHHRRPAAPARRLRSPRSRHRRSPRARRPPSQRRAPQPHPPPRAARRAAAHPDRPAQGPAPARHRRARPRPRRI